MMHEISMQAIFGEQEEYAVSFPELSCYRMVFGRMFMGYGISPAQRDYVRHWLKTDPELVDENVTLPIIYEYGMSIYSPDFSEPDVFRNGFDYQDWMKCRDWWCKLQILRYLNQSRRMYPDPQRFDEWLEIWGVHYQRRIEAAKNPHKED